MKIKYKTEVNDFPKMAANLKLLDGKKINVGCEGENAWLAGIHEYGCRIKVTPKMRAYLHSQGLHLKKSTTEIVIPERSFLRTGFDENHEKVIKKSEKALGKCLTDGNVEPVLEAIGLLLRDAIVDYARDLDSPANHPFTVERKGSSNPLVDTGSMIQSITYEVE